MATIGVNTDATARARAAALLPIVTAAAALTPENPEVDEAYVLRGAVRVGLNRIGGDYNFISHDELEPVTGVDVETSSIDIHDDDLDRINYIASCRSCTAGHVVSAALLTGLAMLSGFEGTQRPVTA